MQTLSLQMLALQTNLAPSLTMQQANPHGLPSAPTATAAVIANNKPLVAGNSPQIIPMATVPQSQFLIRGGYTLLPPIAPLTNVEGASFGGLTPLHPIGGLTRPITAIPYYQPTEIYQQRGGGSAGSATTTVTTEETTSALQNSSSSGLSTPRELRGSQTIVPPPSPPPLTSLPPSHSPGAEISFGTRQTSLPNSLDLTASARSPGATHSPAQSILTTPTDHTPQPNVPRLIAVPKSPVALGHDATPSTAVTPTVSDMDREVAGGTTDDSAYTCSRPKSADAVAKDTSVFGANPYPINALIDVPASLSRGSRTSSLSSSISSFRFGGSLNKLWASQLSLSNKVNMKSTG